MSAKTDTTLGLSPYTIDDLALSGLDPKDIAARPATAIEFAATGNPASRVPDGYVIPYFDIHGNTVHYYRVKVLEPSGGPKYRSITGGPNHIYFPPGWAQLMKKSHNYVIITEGEKKAACATKSGFPCVALSGVDCWRNRQITFPADTQLKAIKSRGVIQARIPSGDSNALVLEGSGVVAKGFQDLIDFLVQQEMEAIIIFDTDKGGLKTQVQRAAAQLGYELRYRGLPISHVRQLILPPSKKGDKIGLDDFLMRKGAKEFASILRACRNKRIAFPRHPNPKTFVASRLQKARLSRKETQDVALSILMELETRGRRLRNIATHDMFFFNERTHTLMDVHLGSIRIMLHDTAFGAYLYREFNLAATDSRVVGWLAAQFHGEPGAEDAETHRVLAKPEGMPNCIAYQLSDSHFIIIAPDPDQPYIICENGQHGVLFEQGHVTPLSHTAMETELEERLDSDEVLWEQVLGDFNFTPTSPSAIDEDTIDTAQLLTEGRNLAILLYYLSPWFLRWKGLQLPVELTIGEPGSGKSSLYELRQTIITGYPRLSNMTSDIKDWYAGITSHGGLHVLDNIHFTGATKDYQQRLSDELCRLVTEPSPHIELRKLYTNAEVISLPVFTTFALTSIEQPFFTADLIQRAAIFELEVIQAGHDANWVSHQISLGDGRIGWVAHQLAIIHKFLRLTVHEKKWNSNYRAAHRLANYEQALLLMAETLGMENDWIPAALQRQTASKLSEADWTMSGMTEFVAWFKKHHGKAYTGKRFSTKDIVEWAENHDTYCKNGGMTNGRRLGKYLRAHRGSIQKTLGVFENGSSGNRIMYSIK